MMVFRQAILSFIIICGLMVIQPIHAKADDRLEASIAVVDNLVARVQIISHKNLTKDEIKTETNAIIDRFFDYKTIARFAAGQAWRKASDTEREDYLTAFRQVLLSLAETQFDYFKRLDYKPTGATAKGKKLVLVGGTIRDKKGEFAPVDIAWRVSTPASKPPRIIDIEIENISMLITQKQEHEAIIRSNQGSFQALIDALHNQAARINTP